jgi:FixJ family two-component response regulator
LNSSHRIGIIDDDSAVRDSTHILLEAHGYQVSEYGSATEYLKRPGADCVLLVDFSMTDLNGMDLVELLRDSDIVTPVILLTDVAEPGLSERIMAADRCIRLNKPVVPRELLSSIGTTTAAAYCLPQHR